MPPGSFEPTPGLDLSEAILSGARRAGAPSRTLYAPHRLDVSLGVLARAALALFPRRADARRAVERAWHPDGLAFLSVRSAFDAALTALDYAPGDEIAVSAMNIGDMIRIIEGHGLVPVPVDLDPRTLAPDPEDLEARLTPRTRAVLVAHLFGGRCDLAGLLAAARRRGLLVFEDAAQAFDGGAWRGHPEADLSFFSFGMLKTATAFGGGLVRVADPALRERMRRVQDGWPAQRWRQFAARVAKVAFIAAFLLPLPYTLFDRVCGLWGTTADEAGRKLTRSFGSLRVEALLRVLRHRPSAPMMRLLAARLSGVNAERVRRRTSHGERVFAGLPERAKPGCDQPVRTHWLVPVAVDDPAGLRGKLRAAGFDSSGPSNVTAFGNGRARALMDGLVFLPAYPELPEERLEALIELLREHLDPEC